MVGAHAIAPSEHAWTEVPLRARLVRLFTAAPHPALAADVEHLWWLESSAPLPRPVARACAAKLAVDVVLTLEGHFAEAAERRLLRGGERAPYVIGPTGAPAEAVASGRCVAVGARLRPGRAGGLLRASGGELRDEVARLDELCGRAVAGLREPAAEGPRAAIVALERALLALLERAAAPDPRVDEALRLIGRSRGRLAVEALARRSGTTVRQLQRRFRDRVGLSPKQGCRIARAEHAAGLLGAAGRVDFGDVVDACGFYDQAHLIRELRALAGATPGALRRARGGCE
jgi:AraC-like DNA-binding protein